jgi:preprotein translocase SecE subunit
MQKILQFLREVKEQFHNITWPKREAIIQLTIVVISISVITSLILGGFDYLFTSSFGILTNLDTGPQPLPLVEPLLEPTPILESTPSAVTPAPTTP